MKIATWNVNGIRARATQLMDWLNADRPDILCLQEIKAAPSQIPLVLSDLEGYWTTWHGAGGYSGVSLHFLKATFPEAPHFRLPEFDFETRIVEATAQDLTVASVYVPNGGKDMNAKMRFLDFLYQYVSAFDPEKHLFLCGDINVARTDMDVHPKERKPKAIGQLPEERALLERILSAGMADTFRDLHPNDDQMFTWWPPWRNMRQRNIGWRIDYILASRKMAALINSCSVLSQVGTSDHAPLIAEYPAQ